MLCTHVVFVCFWQLCMCFVYPRHEKHICTQPVHLAERLAYAEPSQLLHRPCRGEELHLWPLHCILWRRPAAVEVQFMLTAGGVASAALAALRDAWCYLHWPDGEVAVSPAGDSSHNIVAGLGGAAARVSAASDCGHSVQLQLLLSTTQLMAAHVCTKRIMHGASACRHDCMSATLYLNFCCAS